MESDESTIDPDPNPTLMRPMSSAGHVTCMLCLDNALWAWVEACSELHGASGSRDPCPRVCASRQIN